MDALPQPHGRWSIAVFDDPTPNAFALPGGKIGVHTGMLRVARTPDQLAGLVFEATRKGEREVFEGRYHRRRADPGAQTVRAS